MNTYDQIQQRKTFSPPSHWRRIRTVDLHTGGEPLRVILDGFPAIGGGSVLARRRYVRDHHDSLRRALMHEPRGHADMYGCLLTPPNDSGADFGVIFMHNEGYSTMCGHAVIAVSRLAVEMGWVEKREPETKVTIDVPCGRIEAFVSIQDGQVTGVYFHSVPSFVLETALEVDVPGLGAVPYDLVYGGAFYAYVNSDRLDLPLTPTNYRRLIEAGMAIKRAVMSSSQAIEHPFERDLSFLYGTIFVGGPVSEGVDSRNVCVFAEGEVDRCPTGSGVSGRMALHYHKKEIGIGEPLAIEGITGSVFQGSVLEETTCGPYPAVVPRVAGTAFLTGQHEFWIDPEDPFGEGFFLR